MQKDINDLDSSASLLDRREFLVTSIIAGFALAVQPIQAQTQVKTDDKGLIAGEVKIPVTGGVIPAYRAMPDKKGKNFPVVLVIHEIFRRSRIYPGRVPPLCQTRLFGDCARALRAAGRRFDDFDTERTQPRYFLENSRHAGDVRFRFDGRICQKEQRQHEETFDYGILLGRQNRLALRGAQLKC